MKMNAILFVRDQKAATDFYRQVLAREPILDVPGMTEFEIARGAVLGLMPEAGVKRLLGAKVGDLESARAGVRSEIYLTVGEPSEFHQRALQAGAQEMSPLQLRNWGDHAAYCRDLDGHLIVFASGASADASRDTD